MGSKLSTKASLEKGNEQNCKEQKVEVVLILFYEKSTVKTNWKYTEILKYTN